MTVWELAGLMCFASFLIPVVWFFCRKFDVIARQRGQEQIKRDRYTQNGSN